MLDFVIFAVAAVIGLIVILLFFYFSGSDNAKVGWLFGSSASVAPQTIAQILFLLVTGSLLEKLYIGLITHQPCDLGIFCYYITYFFPCSE